MAEKPEKKSPSTNVSGDEFFNVGAPLHAVRPGYVRRPADDLLYETVITGHYAHVRDARPMSTCFATLRRL